MSGLQFGVVLNACGTFSLFFLFSEKRFCGRKRRRLVWREGLAGAGGHGRASAGQLLTRSDWVLLDSVLLELQQKETRLVYWAPPKKEMASAGSTKQTEQIL